MIIFFNFIRLSVHNYVHKAGVQIWNFVKSIVNTTLYEYYQCKYFPTYDIKKILMKLEYVPIPENIVTLNIYGSSEWLNNRVAILFSLVIPLLKRLTLLKVNFSITYQCNIKAFRTNTMQCSFRKNISLLKNTLSSLHLNTVLVSVFCLLEGYLRRG